MCVLGGYLSVRTLLSHSVMIKALPGTPYRPHSHNQPTGQELLSHAAGAPHGSYRITHTHTYTSTHTCTLLLLLFCVFHPSTSLFFPFPSTSLCPRLPQLPLFSTSLLVVALSLLRLILLLLLTRLSCCFMVSFNSCFTLF